MYVYELYMYIFECICSNISIYMFVGKGHRMLGDLSFLLLAESCKVQVRSDLGAVC